MLFSKRETVKQESRKAKTRKKIKQCVKCRVCLRHIRCNVMTKNITRSDFHCFIVTTNNDLMDSLWKNKQKGDMNLDVSRNFHYKSKLNQTLSNNFNWKGLHLSKKNFFMIRVEIQSPILLKHRQNLREAFKKKNFGVNPKSTLF